MGKGSKRRKEDIRKMWDKWDKIRWDKASENTLSEDDKAWSKWSDHNRYKIPELKQKRGKRSKHKTLPDNGTTEQDQGTTG